MVRGVCGLTVTHGASYLVNVAACPDGPARIRVLRADEEIELSAVVSQYEQFPPVD